MPSGSGSGYVVRAVGVRCSMAGMWGALPACVRRGALGGAMGQAMQQVFNPCLQQQRLFFRFLSRR